MPFYGIAIMGDKIAFFVIAREEIIEVIENL